MFFKKFILLLPTLLGGSFLFGQLPKFDSNFESGSLGKVTFKDSSKISSPDGDLLNCYSFEVDSRLDPLNPIDTNLSPSGRWYYFRIIGVKDRMLWMKINNSEAIRPVYSYDNINFFRMDASENPIKNQIIKIFERDTVYISHFIPYNYSRLVKKVDEWNKSGFCKSEVIGESRLNRSIYMLRITNDNKNDSNKRVVWIHGRSHPSETPSSWHLEGMIDYLTSQNSYARALRDNIIFYVVPFINPDGVVGGFSRSTSTGVNMEINWDRDETSTEPEVNVLKRTLSSLLERYSIDMFLNMHSQISPSVTYWIHTAKSTTEPFFRDQMLLSSYTICNSPHYRWEDQSFSDVASRYAEGWIWNRVGERTLAITFETPYTYYNKDMGGDWVSIGNLKELSVSSLKAIGDYFGISSEDRVIIIEPHRVSKSFFDANSEGGYLYSGDKYFISQGSGKIKFRANLSRGQYKVYRWVPGNIYSKEAVNDNCWIFERNLFVSKGGAINIPIRSNKKGELFNSILLIKQ